MAIQTVDDIADGLANSAQRINFFKQFTAPKGAGAFASSWTAPGFPGAGATPPAYTAGSGYTYSSATPGAIPFTNATLVNWLAMLEAASGLQGSLILVDRLWSCSGIPFGAGSHSITTPGSLPARITDGGVGVEAWVENYVAAGAATGTLTLYYLDATGNPQSGTMPTVVSAPVAQQMQPIPIRQDLGISQITSVGKTATWTSGSFGLTLLKRIAEIPSTATAGIGQSVDWAETALANVPNDACLSLVWLATSITTPIVLGNITLIDK